MKKKIALIFGVTGQDGAYLSRFLLNKKYIVHGVIRRSSSFNTSRLEDIYEDPSLKNRKFILHYGDLIDSSSVSSLISKIMPDEIYNLAAQSHVAVSYTIPEYTSNVDGLGTLRILDAIKSINKKKIKFYQAGTSEMFGGTQKKSQNENTPFDPVSPYSTAKLYGFYISKVYREAYGMFITNGILFNHESPRRGPSFVTKKITESVKKIVNGEIAYMSLGNLDSKRDWGYAKEYVESMWVMLQQKKPDDFVIATGKVYSVRNFVEEAFRNVNIKIKWKGTGVNEFGYDMKTKKILVKVDPYYFRPNELNYLRGDYSKSKKILKWRPKVTFKELVKIMIQAEFKN